MAQLLRRSAFRLFVAESEWPQLGLHSDGDSRTADRVKGIPTNGRYKRSNCGHSTAVFAQVRSLKAKNTKDE